MRRPIVEERVRDLAPGTVICPADFTEMTNARNASTQLARLAQKGLIDRVMRGIYWVRPTAAVNDADLEDAPWPPRIEFPERIKFPETAEDLSHPDPLAVAEAIARSNHWEVTPTGSMALFMLGVSDANPEDTSLASSGPSRVYDVFGHGIAFRHTATRYLFGLSVAARLVAQALSTIGRDEITDEVIASVASHIMQADAEELPREFSQLPPWMMNVAKRIRDEKERQIHERLSARNRETTEAPLPNMVAMINALNDNLPPMSALSGVSRRISDSMRPLIEGLDASAISNAHRSMLDGALAALQRGLPETDAPISSIDPDVMKSASAFISNREVRESKPEHTETADVSNRGEADV